MVYHFPGSEVRRQVGKVYSLYSGQHTITITNGPIGANGRRYMDIDGFVSDIRAFPPGTYNDDATLWENRVHYYPLGLFGDGWTTISDPNAYQGEYKMSSATRSGIRINFQGDSIYWFFPRSRSDLGQASITIDGEDHGIYDTYSTGNNYTWWGGLGSGYHEMTITNTGHTSSYGTVLAFARFDVGSTSTYNRVMGSSYADGWAHTTSNFWFNYFPDNNCANFFI